MKTIKSCWFSMMGRRHQRIKRYHPPLYENRRCNNTSSCRGSRRSDLFPRSSDWHLRSRDMRSLRSRLEKGGRTQGRQVQYASKVARYTFAINIVKYFPSFSRKLAREWPFVLFMQTIKTIHTKAVYATCFFHPGHVCHNTRS